MARESKQARHEKRFGKPDRLVDVLAAGKLKSDREHGKDDDEGRQVILDSFHVNVQNVAEYIWGLPADREFRIEKDFPCCVPFQKCLFMEYRESGGMHHGCLLAHVAERSSIFGRYVVSVPAIGFVIPLLNFHFTLGTTGLTITDDSFVNECPSSKGLIDRLWASKVRRSEPPPPLWAWLQPFLLALCFANCKNTTIEPHEPDHKLNRERARHGLKPFVRYHTINIEPMRKVLKTEGGVETNGLKKAIHICRGHFARYSEDRPLFGHTSGLVWRPAHTRGAISQGVVVSDYKVNAPKAEPAASGGAV